MNEKYLENNLFKDCLEEDLRNIWDGYKKIVYNGCWFDENNPLTKYKNIYTNKFGTLGLSMLEIDLLKAIVFKFFDIVPP